MYNYENITIKKPFGVENKKAYLVGGGIASLACAFYLIRDAKMAGSQITVFEESDVLGGAMDGAGNAEDGYIIRGGREMEAHYECCWDMFGAIPSLGDKNKTVLDEIHEINRIDPNVSACRVLHECGKKVLGAELGLSDVQHPAKLDRSLGSSWQLWKNIAKQDSSFGNPDAFCGAIDKTKWLSFTITCTDSPMADILKELTGRDPYSGRAVTGGIVTIKDSSWLLSVTCNRQPHFIDQPKNVLVLWAYGLFADNVGDFVKKKMSECSGEELACELLYHLGQQARIEEILPTLNVIPCMMPYITSQFMPRAKGDRPKVVPEGSTNFAFIGQFCEIEDECVFTAGTLSGLSVWCGSFLKINGKKVHKIDVVSSESDV